MKKLSRLLKRKRMLLLVIGLAVIGAGLVFANMTSQVLSNVSGQDVAASSFSWSNFANFFSRNSNSQGTAGNDSQNDGTNLDKKTRSTSTTSSCNTTPINANLRTAVSNAESGNYSGALALLSGDIKTAILACKNAGNTLSVAVKTTNHVAACNTDALSTNLTKALDYITPAGNNQALTSFFQSSILPDLLACKNAGAKLALVVEVNSSPSPNPSPAVAGVSSGPATYSGKFMAFFHGVQTADGSEYWYLAHGFDHCSISQINDLRGSSAGTRSIASTSADSSGTLGGVTNIPYDEGDIGANFNSLVAYNNNFSCSSGNPLAFFFDPQSYPEIRAQNMRLYNGGAEFRAHAPHHEAYPNQGNAGGAISLTVNGQRITGDPGNPTVYHGPANTALMATISVPSEYTVCYDVIGGQNRKGIGIVNGGGGSFRRNTWLFNGPASGGYIKKVPTSGTFRITYGNIVCAGHLVRPAIVSMGGGG